MTRKMSADAQLEHPVQAHVLGKLIDIVAQPFEHRAATLGALVDELQVELLVGHRVDEQQAGQRIDREVAGRLRHELVRDRHPVLVDLVHPRDVGDVRTTLCVNCADDRGDPALVAALEASERELLLTRLVRSSDVDHLDSGIGAPAIGPGV